jgi:8-oxo-dGTP pyrophosphatase MutT (NUDIX family)
MHNLRFNEFLNEMVKTKPVKVKPVKPNVVDLESHNLSGVVLIYNNKILLVRPKKFRRKMKKWSIPKGHIEEKMSKMKTALRELKEESAIKKKKKHLRDGDKISMDYIKAGFNKKLTCYIVYIEKDEINVKLFNDMILGNFLRGETVEAGFFSKEDAKTLIEKQQLELLEFLD